MFVSSLHSSWAQVSLGHRVTTQHCRKDFARTKFYLQSPSWMADIKHKVTLGKDQGEKGSEKREKEKLTSNRMTNSAHIA